MAHRDHEAYAGQLIRNNPFLQNFHSDFVDRNLILESSPYVIAVDSDSPRITGWVIGPGFSVRDLEHTFLLRVLGGSLPLVLDAGALSSLAGSAELREAVVARSGVTVVTPHIGEFGKLFPRGVDSGPGWDLDSVRAAARELNAIVVAKAPRTVVIGPDGRAHRCGPGAGNCYPFYCFHRPAICGPTQPC